MNDFKPVHQVYIGELLSTRTFEAAIHNLALLCDIYGVEPPEQPYVGSGVGAILNNHYGVIETLGVRLNAPDVPIKLPRYKWDAMPGLDEFNENYFANIARLIDAHTART